MLYLPAVSGLMSLNLIDNNDSSVRTKDFVFPESETWSREDTETSIADGRLFELQAVRHVAQGFSARILNLNNIYNINANNFNSQAAATATKLINVKMPNPINQTITLKATRANSPQ